jgi:hypothetical protein
MSGRALQITTAVLGAIPVLTGIVTMLCRSERLAQHGPRMWMCSRAGPIASDGYAPRADPLTDLLGVQGDLPAREPETMGCD